MVGRAQALPPLLIVQGLAECAQTERMDNKAIRQKNVDHLIDLAGSVGEFACKIDREANQVSQWRSGKPIGDRLARDIEAQLGKDAGWLDLPQWEEDKTFTPPSQDESQPPRLDPEIVSEAHRLLREVYAADDVPRVYSIEAEPDLFAMAYETLARADKGAARPAAYFAVGRLIGLQRAAQGHGQQGQSERAGGVDQTPGKKRASR